MKKIIVPEFQAEVHGLIEQGVSKQKAAKRLGVSRPTIRRALAALAAALAEAGQAQSVYVGDVIPPPGHHGPAPAPAPATRVARGSMPSPLYA